MSAGKAARATGELPGILEAGDARVPEEVRARFGEYRKTVTSVIPVSGMQREEWWLFAEHGLLLDVLVRSSSTAQ